MKLLKMLRIAIFAVLFTINPGPKLDYAQGGATIGFNKAATSVSTIPEKHEEKNKFVFNIPSKGSHRAFLRSVGFTESSNRYDTINRYGYLGRYQFSKATLKGLGIQTEPQSFLKDRDLQEYAMHKYLKYNKIILKDIINQYNDTLLYMNHRQVPDTNMEVTHNMYSDTLLISDTTYHITLIDVYDTIYVSESGILAAAHLSGAGNVKKFFKHLEADSLHNPKDKLGTSLLDYLSKFSGYDLALR